LPELALIPQHAQYTSRRSFGTYGVDSTQLDGGRVSEFFVRWTFVGAALSLQIVVVCHLFLSLVLAQPKTPHNPIFTAGY
jgi:hypothetical protein